MDKTIFEFKPKFLIAGTMYINNKTEVTYDDIQNTIKNLKDKVIKNGNRCLILFSNEYLKELEYDFKNVFYCGNTFVALNKEYDINYLTQHILSYAPLEILIYLSELKNNKVRTNLDSENNGPGLEK